MKKVLFAIMLFTSFSVFAVSDPIDTVFTKFGCPSCHSITNVGTGPSYVNISVAHKGDVTAEDKLINVVSNGSANMPAQDANGTHRPEMTRMVRYILGVDR